MTWLQIARMALALARAIREKTRKVCPNPDCPLRLNVKGEEKDVKPKLTTDEQIARQKELFRKNHPGR